MLAVRGVWMVMVLVLFVFGWLSDLVVADRPSRSVEVVALRLRLAAAFRFWVHRARGCSDVFF